MMVGMVVLGGLFQLIFAILGHGNVLHYAGLRALLMTGNMVIGMSLWMRHRRHSWTSVRKMSGAMCIPLAVLIIPYGAGMLSAGASFALLHVLMLPCMLGAMLLNRDEYSRDHRQQSKSPVTNRLLFTAGRRLT